MTMYERIKTMTKEEMQDFIYWVYKSGNEDGCDGLCDNYVNYTYFGGVMLNKNAEEVMAKVHEFYSYE